MPQTIGRTMLATLQSVQDLIAVTHDDQRLTELNAQRTDLVTKIAALVDANLDSSTKQYAAATTALQGASDTITNAIKGLAAVADAINDVAEALDLVAALIPT